MSLDDIGLAGAADEQPSQVAYGYRPAIPPLGIKRESVSYRLLSMSWIASLRVVSWL